MNRLRARADEVLAAVRAELARPESDRVTRAPTISLQAVAERVDLVGAALERGDRAGAREHANEASRLAIDRWDMMADLTERVVELSDLVGRRDDG